MGQMQKRINKSLHFFMFPMEICVISGGKPEQEDCGLRLPG